MRACPICKAVAADSHGRCRSCGRGGDDPTSGPLPGPPVGDGWGDDDPLSEGGLDLSLSPGGSLSGPAGPSTYAGGGVSFGGDDDPFADEVPQGALELDLPAHHGANAPRSPEAPPRPEAMPGSVPDLVVPPSRRSHAAPLARTPEVAAGRPEAPLLSTAQSAAVPGPNVPEEDAPPLSPGSEPSPVSAGPPVAVPSRPQPDPAAMIARFPAAPHEVWEAPLYAMKVLWRQFELRQDLAALRRRRSPDVALYERALQTHDANVFALGVALTCAGLAIASFVFFLPVILRFLRAPD